MATKHQLVSDIILRVTKGKPADDLELEPKQVEFWIQLALDGLITEALNANVGIRDYVPEFYVRSEKCRALNQEVLDCVEDDKERLYIVLSKPPLELLGDRAIIRVKTNTGDTAHKARLSTIDFIEHLEFAKPGLDNLVYYRDGKQKLVICGVPKALKESLDFFVWYVPQTNLECFSDNEEVPIANDMLDELLARVEDIARRQMSGAPDLENDGQDDAAPAVQQ